MENYLFCYSIFEALYSEDSRASYEMHARRMAKARRTVFWYYLLIFLPATCLWAMVVVLSLVILTSNSSSLNENTPHLTMLGAAIVMGITYNLLTFVLILTTFKIAHSLTMKSFADSACALSCAYVVIRLSQDDVLTRTQKRVALLESIDWLARNTRALGSIFAGSRVMDRQWTIKHFRNIENYIRERQRWAAVPVGSTLGDLRNDFDKLARIYLNQDYGTFEWPLVETTPESEVDNPSKKGIRDLVSKIFGVVLPIILLVLLLWQREYLNNAKVPIDIVALIFLSWLLLALDISLKLGIVASAADLAKTIRGIK